MKHVGMTTDGKAVFDGVGTMCFTNGIPLEMVLDHLKAQNAVPDWIDYIQTARKDGHNDRTIRSRISAAVGDVFGPAYRDEVLKRVDQVLQ